MTAIWVEITATRGSAPRNAGTAMKVTATGTQGTIGGGALEHRAIAQARAMLSEGKVNLEETLPLGPGLGQCCGGSVTLHYGPVEKPVDQPISSFSFSSLQQKPKTQLWLWGAGHVGRAIAEIAPLCAFEITWVDENADRFPTRIRDGITPLHAADMPLLAARAPLETQHLIFTYAHDIDLALCAALLRRGVTGIGLIGSDTKWARFSKRLRAMSLEPDRITCPIGNKALGKAPAQIANGVVQSLLSAPLKASA